MIMKTLLSILFLFVCAFAHAQYHNVEGIRVVGRSDSTTISNVGQIQFDADDDKFRFNDGTGWYSFLRDDATLPYLPLTVSSSINVDVALEEVLSFGLDDFTQTIYVFPSATTPFAGMLAGANKLYMDGQGIHIETDTSLLVSGDGEGDFNVTNFNKATFQPGSVGTPLVMSGGGSLSKPSVEWGGSASVNRVGRPTIFLGGNGGTVDIVDDPTTMVFSNRTGDGGFTLSFEATAGNHEAFIRDHSSNPIGIQYAADYSANYTARTLVDKGYVDGKFDGIQVPEGANKTMGIATLSSGTVTVNTTAVTANSRIFLTVNGGTLTNVGTPYVSARSAGTSFTITSTNASDASDVAWLIIEPAP